jgi:hypothetical protein
MNKYLTKLRSLTFSEVPPIQPDKTDKTHPGTGFVSFVGSPGGAISEKGPPSADQALSLMKGAECSPNTRAPFYAKTIIALRERCPDHVESERWRQALTDAEGFLVEWGEQAQALGWTTRDLFGLHEVPATPHATYQRLSRYDCTGLVWLLQGSPVVALTEATAAIRMPTGSITTYRLHNKPAFGPLGDSIDDFKP